MMYFSNGQVLSAAEVDRSGYSLMDLVNPALLDMLPENKKTGSIFAKPDDYI